MKRLYSTPFSGWRRLLDIALRGVCALAIPAAGSGLAAAATAGQDVRYFFDANTARSTFTAPTNPLLDATGIQTRAKTWKNLLTGEVKSGYVTGNGLHRLDAWALSGVRDDMYDDTTPVGTGLPLIQMKPDYYSLGTPPAGGPFLNLRTRTGASASFTANGTTDRYTLGTISRRTTLDGSEYESLAVTVERNGVLWLTHHLGYRLGRVAGQTAAIVPAADQERYDLVSLPEPIVEGMVTEYIYRPVVPNSPWGHFFYAASEAERTLLDGNDDWMRSGREFKSGGYLPVCRFFYRPPNGGPATHFYTAKADECERFKTTPGFSYEGTPFRASLPRPQADGQAANDPARCPEKTVALWRYFNQPTNAAVAPNHRYLLTSEVGNSMTRPGQPKQSQPWVAEGIALCVPE